MVIDQKSITFPRARFARDFHCECVIPMEEEGLILPLDLVIECLSYCTRHDAWVCTFVCRLWRALLRAPLHGGVVLLRRIILRNAERGSTVRNPMARAIWIGSIAQMQWIHAMGWVSAMHPVNTECAARAGHTHILEWLHKRGAPFGDMVSWGAGRAGHVHCLQWLHDHGVDVISQGKNLAGMVVSMGHVHCLQWLHAHGVPVLEHYYYNAALHGQLACLQWLHANGAPLPRIFRNRRDLTKWFVNGGNLACLQWYHSVGGLLRITAYKHARKRGDRAEVVQWLYTIIPEIELREAWDPTWGQ
jgi:hypothetical protein